MRRKKQETKGPGTYNCRGMTALLASGVGWKAEDRVVVGCGIGSAVLDTSRDVVETITPVEPGGDRIEFDEVRVDVNSTNVEEVGAGVGVDEAVDESELDVVVVVVGVLEVLDVVMVGGVAIVRDVSVVDIVVVVVSVGEVVVIDVPVNVRDSVADKPVETLGVP